VFSIFESTEADIGVAVGELGVALLLLLLLFSCCCFIDFIERVVGEFETLSLLLLLLAPLLALLRALFPLLFPSDFSPRVLISSNIFFFELARLRFVITCLFSAKSKDK
jgi:hypothetical protein